MKKLINKFAVLVLGSLVVVAPVTETALWDECVDGSTPSPILQIAPLP